MIGCHYRRIQRQNILYDLVAFKRKEKKERERIPGQRVIEVSGRQISIKFHHHGLSGSNKTTIFI